MMVLRLILVTMVAMAASMQTPVSDATPVGDTDVQVDIAQGTLRGYADSDAEYFLGIPYAAPPIDDLRWQPPAEAEGWDGVRDATEYGAYCAAAESTNGPRSEAEDCLFLNVYRPVGTTEADQLPVYVFIHGGGFVNGSSNQADAADIAQINNIVTVSINYRLGILGFLAHPALTEEGEGSSGNYGIMDQQAALQWVQANIASFGGDPAAVTIGGESAGGASVCAHLTSPGSEGLFSQAMIQSGACWMSPLEVAESMGVGMVTELGCEGDDVASCLRGLSVADILEYEIPGLIPPVFGDSVLPEDPNVVIAEGRAYPVPLLFGWNRDEGRVFGLGNIGMTAESYEEAVTAQYGDRAEEFKALYPWPSDGVNEFTGVYVMGGAFSDQFACDSFDLAEQFGASSPDVYVYIFSHQYGPGLNPEIFPPDYNWGAGHAAELAFLFPSFHNGVPLAPIFDPDEQVLAFQMKLAWGQFIVTGSPNADGLIVWTPFSDTGSVMILHAGNNSVTTDVGVLKDRHNCDFWNTIEGGAL